MNYETPDSQVIDSFPGININIVHQLQMFNPVEFDTIEELLLYTHLGLINTYLTSDIDQFREIIRSDKRFSISKRKQRASLLEVNRNSIVLSLDSSNKSAPAKLKSAFLSLGASTLELPMDYDVNRTVTAFEWYISILQNIGFPDGERGYHLKFKKLGTYKDNGYYSHETNTIIVDPREIDVYFHELGHLIYDRCIKIKYNIEASSSEDYAQKFWDAVMRQHFL